MRTKQLQSNMGVNKNIAAFACILTLIFCCVTLGQLVLFLSSHTFLQYPYFKDVSMKYRTVGHGMSFGTILHNLSLLVIFGLQHTLMANENFKNFLSGKDLGVIERLLYNCGSCIGLQIIMYFWKPIHDRTLWEVSTYDHAALWWIFTIIHFTAWLTTYSGCFIMDITELLGAKQVYHYVLNWPHPLCQKSQGLLRFYSHMRHPGFSALIAVLFIHPVMQLDRIILGCFLVIYMIAAFKVDDIDYAYQRRMLQRKYRDLTANS